MSNKEFPRTRAYREGLTMWCSCGTFKIRRSGIPVHSISSEVQDIEHGKESSSRHSDNTDNSTCKSLFLPLILMSTLFDPLFFYIPAVNNDSNCLGLDNNLRIIVLVLRTFIDGVYVLLYRHRKKREERRLHWTAATAAFLPLPQVIVYAATWRLRTVKLLKFMVLIQFVPRGYVMRRDYKSARERPNNIKHPREGSNVWLAAAFYLLLFIIASNVFGAFWYLRAIERNMDCWRKACKARDLCGVSSFYCHGSSSNNGYLDEFCLMPPAPNSTFFDHGIYLDAFQREIIGIHTNFFNKLFYCLLWGLQSLSSFGQNLKPGTYLWDEVFAIFTVISGLVLFALLIGTMQEYLQKEAASDMNSDKKKPVLQKRQGRMTRIEVESLRWPLFHSLPTSLGKEVLLCKQEEWPQTTEINLETLLNNIRPLTLRREIRQVLSKNLFSKVEKFKNLHLEVRRKLRERAKAVVFQEKNIIQQEGDPIYEMIHILNGNALIITGDGNQSERQAYTIKRNDLIGEQILDKALESSEPNLPLATQTIHAVTKIEAFTLSFSDFVGVFTESGNLVPGYEEEWASRIIARAFRRYRYSWVMRRNGLHVLSWRNSG